VRDLLLFLLTAWAATAAGRTVLRRLRLPGDVTPLERNLFGLALGLGLLAYGMLALGLAHALYPFAGWGLLGVLALVGGPEHAGMAREIGAAVRGLARSSWAGRGLVLLFALLAAVPLVGVWTPPVVGLGAFGYTEWDSLSYHLADPKIYLGAHRILYLPWESHSNFAFTAEMWYLYGLMLGGVPLAKLFHFACGAGACAGVYALGARLTSARVGLLAALILGSTPLVLWEAGTAYADLAGTFFATLTLLAFARGVAGRSRRWLCLAALLMGLTLSAKATALTTLALLALALLAWRLRAGGGPWPRALAAAAAWGALALLVGSPWYVKSAAYTGNPVYPFYERLFPSRHWNAALGAQYDASNANFGVGTTLRELHSPAQAALTPWNLTMYLVPGHLPPSPNFRPFNDFQTPLAALSPLLLAALFFPAFSRGAPGGIKAFALYASLSLGLWFVTAQYVRYLLPTVPVLSLLAAWVLERAWAGRWRSRYALFALGVGSLAFTASVGAQLWALQAPVAFGQVSDGDYIARGFAPYEAMQFINQQLPLGTKVAFYGCPLGFYCDRPYLWADAQHSTLIPYDRFRSPDDLRASLRVLGVTHVLVWAKFFPLTPDAQDYTRWVYGVTAGSGPPVFEARGVAVYALKRDALGGAK
jgi:hypothetical protein